MLENYLKNGLLEDLFIIGGIENENYRKLNNSLSMLRSNQSTILPTPKMVSSERFTMFIKKIKYHNFCVNMIENSNSIDDITNSTWITDVSIVCDRSHNASIVAICKYIGTKEEMNGDDRPFDPTVIHIFHIILKEEHVFIFPARTTSPFIMEIIKDVETKVQKHSSNKDLAKHVIDNLIP